MTDKAALGDYCAALSARLATIPGVQRTPNRLVDIFTRRDFLDDVECQLLIDKIDRERRPSTLLAPTDDKEFRTSDSCDFDRQEPEVDAIERKIDEFVGIPHRRGETIQGQRYAVGQQFKPHHDWFYIDQKYWPEESKRGGQRVWTVMIYLNDTQIGGATRFKKIGKMFKAERGKLLCWSNLDHAGEPNVWTLHQGMKVRAGVKYIITKWYREQPWGYA